MNSKPNQYIAAILLALPAAITAVAADRHPCADIADAAARLACYDAAFGGPAAPPQAAVRQAPTAAAAVAPAAPVATPAPASATIKAAPAASPATAQETFGLHGEQARPPVPEPPREASVESIDSVIKGVAKRPTGELIVALENGQTWVQQEADSTVRLRPGDPVTIRKAALGSYKLVSGPNTTRVRRIK